MTLSMQPSSLILLEPRVGCALPLLLEACKNIPTLKFLFNVLPIIAEGHSMNLRKDVLEDPMVELFHDFEERVGFPAMHAQNSDTPQAAQVLMAGFIGHLLARMKLKKKKGGDLCIAQLMTEVHARTGRLRSIPLGTKVPNVERLQLFTAILEVLFCTIPLARCPVGFGRALDPVRISGTRRVRGMLQGIEKLVDGILAAQVPSAKDIDPPPYSE
ncbi:hypothetical protein DL96DRAFT_1818015 [Flagelloscypha sp. PMI_526]|nr:hypothetical protein DL96DRAFT_1818015 [Flagelloscypha sp. PMI_526]